MAFKAGDRVVISPPEDRGDGPGYNGDMEHELRQCGGRMTLLERNGRSGWWYVEEDGGSWIWDESWMKKAVQFKGNK